MPWSRRTGVLAVTAGINGNYKRTTVIERSEGRVSLVWDVEEIIAKDRDNKGIVVVGGRERYGDKDSLGVPTRKWRRRRGLKRGLNII